jgi:hypothetical protein
MADLIERFVNFNACLHRVAAVDEHRRAILEHDGRTRGAGKPGEPRQALRIGRHILALMLIGVRHDEAGKSVAFQPRAQGVQSRGVIRLFLAVFGAELRQESRQLSLQLGLGAGTNEIDPRLGFKTVRGGGDTGDEFARFGDTDRCPGPLQQPLQTAVVAMHQVQGIDPYGLVNRLLAPKL